MWSGPGVRGVGAAFIRHLGHFQTALAVDTNSVEREWADFVDFGDRETIVSNGDTHDGCF